MPMGQMMCTTGFTICKVPFIQMESLNYDCIDKITKDSSELRMTTTWKRNTVRAM